MILMPQACTNGQAITDSLEINMDIYIFYDFRVRFIIHAIIQHIRILGILIHRWIVSESQPDHGGILDADPGHRELRNSILIRNHWLP